ncbi:MAG: hypothetical protein ACK5PS_08640 [Desulfopila sp.]
MTREKKISGQYPKTALQLFASPAPIIPSLPTISLRLLETVKAAGMHFSGQRPANRIDSAGAKSESTPFHPSF